MKLTEFATALRRSPAYADTEGKSIIDGHLERIGQAKDVGEQSRLIGEMTGRLRAVLDTLEKSDPDPASETPPGALPDIVQSPESYENMSPQEIKADIERQHKGRLATMRYFGIIDDENNPEVECIDNKRRKAPTHDEIWQELSKPENSSKMDAIKTLKSPKMIITPIGMPLSTLADKVGSKNGRMKKGGGVLKQEPVYRDGWDINSDVTGAMRYFPSKFEKEGHGGKTKKELLNDSPFPGWQVVFVDGEQEVKDTDKDATYFLEKWGKEGYDAMTIEEGMMVHPEGVVAPFEEGNEAHPFNRRSYEWALGSYIPGKGEKGVVPNVYWVEAFRLLYLRWDDPDNHDADLGPRRAVRVF
jgi:hypothetical protein